MKGQEITTSFRTLIGPWVAVFCAGLMALNNIQRWAVYEGEFLWAVDMQGIAVFLVGPILTAAVAVDTARMSRPGNRHLVLLQPRIYRQYWYILWATLRVTYLGYATCLIAVTLSILAKVGFVSELRSAAMQIAVHLAWMFFYAALGTLIGRYVAPLLAGVLGVLLGLAVLNAQSTLDGDGFSLMRLGGATFTRLGNEYNFAFLLTQLLIFLILGAIAVMAPITVRGEYLRPTAVSFGIVLLVGVITFSSWSFLPQDRWTSSPRPPTDCTVINDRTELCTYAEHPVFQQRLTQVVETIHLAADRLEIDDFVPALITEESRTFYADFSAEPLELAITHYDDELEFGYYLPMIFDGAHCEQRYAQETTDWLTDFFERHNSFTQTVAAAAGEYHVIDEVVSAEEIAEFMNAYKACEFGSG